MSIGLLGCFEPDTKPQIIKDFLEQSMYDELFEIDLKQDRFRLIYHIEEKYYMPVMEGDYHQFFHYAADHGIHPDDREEYRNLMEPEALEEAMQSSRIPGTAFVRCRVRGIDRHWRWVEHVLISGEAYGLPDGLVRCYLYDVQQIKDREEGNGRTAAKHTVLPDSLTGLYRSKDFFNFAQTMRYEKEDGWVLIVIDLEKFKLFNDWYGRENGDLVLASTGSILFRAAEQSGGLAGYMANDDFSLLVPEGRVDIDALFNSIHDVIRHYGISAGFQPAFGICQVVEKIPLMDIYDMASMACEKAKKDYRNRICHYDSSLFEEKEKEYQLLSEFQKALENHDIQVYFQPQCHASVRKIVGAEALTRWIREDGSVISPGVFVPILERYGFVTDLDQYMWEQVCIWQRSWLDRGRVSVPVSVNVSQVDLFTIDVPETFIRLTDKYRLDRHLIEVEITESAASEDLSVVRNVVKRLQAAGFTVLMDDFGNGYASLNMLHEMEMNVIKLDARFLMSDKALEYRGIHILESVVSMTKTMGIPVIVEGVEEQGECEFLMQMGCRYIQGYYFYRPMPQREFEALLEKPENLDLKGIRFKENEQFHMREFLDESVYSDTMLNSILGAVALYSFDGTDVDIIRFNEQFYEVVNEISFHERLKGIQRYMPNEDRERLLAALEQAFRDRLNGSSAVLNFYKTDGRTFRFLIHFYYLGEEGGNRRYYGSAQNITEITRLQKQMELISEFFSGCLIFVRDRGDSHSFRVAAHGFSEEMGLTAEELEKELNDGVFLNRVAPEYRELLSDYTQDALIGIDFSTYFTVFNRQGKRLTLYIKSEYVNDPGSDVRSLYIISRRQGEG